MDCIISVVESMGLGYKLIMIFSKPLYTMSNPATRVLIVCLIGVSEVIVKLQTPLLFLEIYCSLCPAAHFISESFLAGTAHTVPAIHMEANWFN